MLHFICFICFFSVSLSALAFSGGSGRASNIYSRHPGVDSFGAHIHPDSSGTDIEIFDLSKDPNAVLCYNGIWCCQAGFILDVTQKKCIPCPKGTYSLQGNFSCLPCPDGTYSDTESSLSCQKVPDGYIANEDKTGIEIFCDYSGVICTDRCCPEGTSCGENDTCCLNGTCSKSDKFFCVSTDEKGDCTSWKACSFIHSGSSIVGAINATGTCASTGGERIYCKFTNDTGLCTLWKKCYKTNSGDKILGIPNAEGRCIDFSHQSLFCTKTNENGDCFQWGVCSSLNSGSSIIGIPNARGVCGPKTQDSCTSFGFVWCVDTCYPAGTECSI